LVILFQVILNFFHNSSRESSNSL